MRLSTLIILALHLRSVPAAAAAGSSAEMLGRFAVWGDVRNDPGQTATSPGFFTVVQALEKTSFSHSITVGDYILAGGDPVADAARYDNFLAAARPLTGERTTHWVAGNHDRVYDPVDDQLYHEKLWGEASRRPR